MVSQSLRLKNFLLDTCIYILFIMLFFYLFRGQIRQENVRWIAILIYFLYYAGFEWALQQTPGKMITRCRVISLKPNQPYYFLRILARSLMRFIPFDILSYLFDSRGLHDWVSGTTIIKK